MKPYLKKTIAVAICVGGICIFMLMSESRAEIGHTSHVEESIPVTVFKAHTQNIPIRIPISGEIQATHRFKISPQVEGIVSEVHPNLYNGGTINKGERLFSLDPRPYEFVLAEKKARLDKAESQLELERGRQAIAQREFQLFDTPERSRNAPLALRKPQLKEKLAEISIAKASVNLAKLDLERTSLLAPCDVVVLEESIEKGQLIRAYEVVATLAPANKVQMLARIPNTYLRWINATNGIHKATIENSGHTGTIRSILKEVDPIGRLSGVLIDFSDTKASTDLIIGSYIQGSIEGSVIPNLVEIPRSALRANDTLWIAKQNNQLEIRPVSIFWELPDSILLSEGVSNGDQIIRSSIALPQNGMSLQIEQTDAPLIEHGYTAQN